MAEPAKTCSAIINNERDIPCRHAVERRLQALHDNQDPAL
jgi:hypothetical protein